MFYVYCLINPITGEPFYVGKGSKSRSAWHARQIRNGKRTDNPHKDRTIDNIHRHGYEVIVVHVYETECEKDAYDHEKGLINTIGISRLTNICADSRPPRPVRDENYRAVMSQRLRGNKINLGRVHTESNRTKISESLKTAYRSGARLVSERMKSRSSETHRGKMVSESTRVKISASRRGKTLNELWGEAAFTAHKSGALADATSRLVFANKERTAGRSYEEIYGYGRAKKLKQKQSSWTIENRGIKISLFGVSYKSLSEASRATGLNRYSVRKYCDYQ